MLLARPGIRVNLTDKAGRVNPNQRDIQGRNLVHWAATLDCVDAMRKIARAPGVRLDQRDSHGKTPIDIAFVCQSKHVGLFLAEKVPQLNMYSWDLMYRAPEVLWRAEDDDVDAAQGGDLLARHARR